VAEQGIVKWYSIARGYGFITPEGEGKDVFVHYSAVASEDLPLREGDRVSFESEESPKGPRAKNVTRSRPPAE
jgi:CspA family cold shock protein